MKHDKTLPIKEGFATWELIAMFIDDVYEADEYFMEEVIEKGIGKMYISRIEQNEETISHIRGMDMIEEPEMYLRLLEEVDELLDATLMALHNREEYTREYYKRHKDTTETDEMFYLEYLMSNEAEMLLSGYMRLYGIYNLVYGLEPSLSYMKSLVKAARG